jgi:arylsulfatase A-like enzyme
VELLDIYPTLVDLLGLPAREDLDGVSLRAQLEDPGAMRRPAISTYEPGNHVALSQKWRYIRYADGSEELYDRVNDPNDWFNLAGDPQHAEVKRQLARHMPQSSASPLPGRDAYDFDFQTYTYGRK